MDVDLSPVYGDYYYQDGERRQNVVEVNIIAVFFKKKKLKKLNFLQK